MIELKLDTQSINTLFPEGSQARVNLQRAVIQNFADRIIKGKGGLEVIAYLDRNLKPIVEDETRNFMCQYMTQHSWTRTNSINADFAKLLAKEFKSQVNDIVEQAKQDAASLIKNQLASMLTEIPKKIDSQVEQAVYQRGRKDAIEAINAAIATNKLA